MPKELRPFVWTPDITTLNHPLPSRLRPSRGERLYLNLSSWIGSIEINVGILLSAIGAAPVPDDKKQIHMYIRGLKHFVGTSDLSILNHRIERSWEEIRLHQTPPPPSHCSQQNQCSSLRTLRRLQSLAEECFLICLNYHDPGSVHLNKKEHCWYVLIQHSLRCP